MSTDPARLTDNEREDLWRAYESWTEGDFSEHMGEAVEGIMRSLVRRFDFAAVLAQHADCVANDSRSREWIDGSAVTGFDVWSCGLEIPFVDDLDEMERQHIAAAIRVAMGGPVPDKAPEACEVAAQGDARGQLDPNHTAVIQGRQIEGEGR